MDQSKDNQPSPGEEISNEEVVVEPIKTQKPWIQRYGFSLIVLALCLVMGYFILQQQNKEDELPVQGKGAEFSYTDMNGETVTLSGTNGKARLLYFFFANCPDVCPPTTFVMSQVQDQLKEEGIFGKDVEFLSVTIDPERDTPELLKDYSERFDADPAGWKFLRGDEEATKKLAREYQILVENPRLDLGERLHRARRRHRREAHSGGHGEKNQKRAVGVRPTAPIERSPDFGGTLFCVRRLPERRSSAKVTNAAMSVPSERRSPAKVRKHNLSGPPEYHSLFKVTKHCNERSAGVP